MLPQSINGLWSRIEVLFRRRRLSHDIDDELHFHLDERTQENIAAGMAPQEARRAARLSLGNPAAFHEETREVWTLPFLETLWQDIRYGLRQLRRSPGFTIVAIVTLALGIGANTAIFSVVNSVLLRPLPVHDPSRVVVFRLNVPKIKLLSSTLSPPNFRAFSRDTGVFESTAAFLEGGLYLTGSGQAQRLLAMHASATFLPLLGIHPMLGRAFTTAEDAYGRGHVVLLSQGLWRSAFGASPKAIGKRIQLNDESYRIIGVLPPSLEIVYPHVQLMVPLALPPKAFSDENEGNLYLRMLARLRPGVTLKQVRATLAVEAAREIVSISPQERPVLAGFSIEAVPLTKDVTGSVGRPLYLLLGAVLLVLLIACANVASLLLARASTRSHEMAIRAAMGAGRRRVVSQLLTESVLLSLAGGVVGLLFAWWGISALVRLAPANLPHPGTIHLDSTVLAFTFLVSILAGILFGLAPALVSSKVDLTDSLKESARSSPSLGRSRLRRGLILSEVALTFVLLVGAGLLLRSFAKLMEVNLGFDPARLLTMDITPSRPVSGPQSRWQGKYAAFSRDLLRRVSAIPGVVHAALANEPPFMGPSDSNFFIHDYHFSRSGPQPQAYTVATSPGYFATMGIPLLYGRVYSAEDIQANSPVAVVDQALADRFWPGQSALGKQIGESTNGPWYRIIGVVGTVRNHTLARERWGTLYFPAYYPGMSLVVRTASNPATLAGAIRSQIEALDPTQAVYSVKTMSQRVAESLTQQRFAAALLALFAALALVLAAVGLYSLMAYIVAQRTHEIGIRMALGADRAGMLQMVVRQGIGLVLIGLLVGAGGALALTRVMRSLLYGVTPTDPVTFLGVAFLLGLVAFAACYLPARRAMRVDPVTALKYE